MSVIRIPVPTRRTIVTGPHTKLLIDPKNSCINYPLCF